MVCLSSFPENYHFVTPWYAHKPFILHIGTARVEVPAFIPHKDAMVPISGSVFQI